MTRFLTAGISASMLVACGGSGGSADDPALPLGTTTQARNTPILSVTPSALEGSYVLNQGAGNTLLIGNPDLDSGAFDAAGSSSEEMVFRAETEDARVTLTRDAMDATGVRFERLTSTTLPMGSMNYNGDYVAIVSNTENGNVVYLINGDAELDVDFASGSVWGEISDRVVLGPSGDPAIGVTAYNISLEEGTLNSQGVFSGGTVSGNITTAFGTTSTADSTFDGLIAGEMGDQVVGGLDIIHGTTGPDYLEEGAFFLDTTLVP